MKCDKYTDGVLGFWGFGNNSVLNILGLKDHRVNQLINYGGDCRTAPATPGLLMMKD